MKVELKNIKISERLSFESISFSAIIYINGVKVGMATNNGRGGQTYCLPNNDNTSATVLQKADEYDYN